jgi:hypothetical protein
MEKERAELFRKFLGRPVAHIRAALLEVVNSIKGLVEAQNAI